MALEIATTAIRSYLNNKKQFKVIHSEHSSLRDITCGIPQGSTPGPLLFIIYI